MNSVRSLQTKNETSSTALLARGILQRKCACGQQKQAGGECAECKKKKLALQRRSISAAKPSGVPDVVHEVLGSSGQAIDPAIRAFIEPRFGHDFSQVRVHTDAKAGESARAVNAVAYTVGQDIVFDAAFYNPSSEQGMFLLAHELAHSVQQKSNANFSAKSNVDLQVGAATSSLEVEADRAAAQVLSPAVDGVSAMPGKGPTLSNTAPMLSRTDCTRLSYNQCRTGIYKCGHGGSGTCGWTGYEGKCKCLGASQPSTRDMLPSWLAWVLSAAAIAAIGACFATGVCEFGLVVAGLGSAAAAAVIGILNAAGVRDSGGGGDTA